MAEFRHKGDHVVYKGGAWNVVVGSFLDPDGELFTRDIVRSPGSVAVLPLMFDPEGVPSVVLLRQYRPTYGEFIYELPAGMRDVPGEPIEITAQRELLEEGGLIAEKLQHIFSMKPSPGMTDAVTELFLATGCTQGDSDRQGPEEEHMEIHHLPMQRALTMIDEGEITDAKTVTALLLVNRLLLQRDSAH